MGSKKTPKPAFGPLPAFALMIWIALIPCAKNDAPCAVAFADEDVLTACDSISNSTPRSAFSVEPGPLKEIADAISNSVGKVVASGKASGNRAVFVFEESHTSRIGQLEIALMLLRLHNKHSLRLISLEGAISDDGFLSADWFRRATSTETAEREGKKVAVRLLTEGEINSAELIAMTQPDVQVKGNEKEDEYKVKPPALDLTLNYLARIAEKSLPPKQARQVNELLRAQNEKKVAEVIGDSDPWLRDRYQKLQGGSALAAEEMITLLQEIEAKANQVGAEIDEEQRANIHSQIDFFKIVSQRSCTMVKNTFSLNKHAPESPVALIIGTAHTCRVVDLLKAAGASYVVISPLSLNDPLKMGDLTRPMYERKIALKSVDGSGLTGAFLDGRHKPGVVLGKQWFQTKTELYTATALIVGAASSGIPPFGGLRSELQVFRSINIDRSSFKAIKKGRQIRVMYKLTALTDERDPRRSVEIWAGGWKETPKPAGAKTPASLHDEAADLEKLIQRVLLDERGKPPLKPESDPCAKPGEAVILQLSSETKAAFSTDRAAVERAITSR